jgi:hypothetical protein
MSRILLAAALFLMSSLSTAWALRVLEQPEESYELVLRDVILPGSEAGSVIFTPCSGCNSVALRVTASTRYLVEGKPAKLEDLLKAAESLRQNGDASTNTAVYVYYDVESKRVNRLALDYLGR